MTTATSARLSFREKLFYGFGDLGSCLFWNSFQINLLMYYTDVFGISAASAGLIFFVSKFWDALNDPLVGMLADRTKTRWGRYRPYILWFTLPLCVSAVLMFTTPDLGATGKLVWAWVTYNLVMTCYTLVNIPYTALLGTISPDAHERAGVSTFKFACAFAAGIIVNYTFMPMTKAFAEGSTPQHGWQMAFLVVSAISVPFFLLCFLGTKERVVPAETQRSSMRQDMKDLIVNRPWLILVGLTMAFVFFVALRSTVMNHYLKYYVVGDAATVSVNLPFAGPQSWDFETLQRWFNTSGQFCSVIGVLIGGLFVKRLEKKWNFIMWFTLGTACNTWNYWLQPDQVELILLVNVLGSMSTAPVCVLIWAMYSDAAEYSEWKNNRQAAGLIFSASTFAQQLGWGFGPALAAWMLDRYGYQPNVVQGPEVLQGMVLLVSLYSAAFGVVAIGFMLVYPLNDQRVHEMSAELKLRREAAGKPAG